MARLAAKAPRGGADRPADGSVDTDPVDTDPVERPGQLLADRLVAVMRLVRVTSSRSEIAGLTNARYEFLHAMVHAGPVRMSVLGRQLGISPRTVTPMVDSLEAAGLVLRAADPSDRRAQLLTLTPDGLELIKQAHLERIAMAETLFASLSPHQRDTFGHLLNKIIDAAADNPPR